MSWLLVTPAFNETDRLPAQARSLAAQTAPLIGLWVVVDDGSTDGTATCVDWDALPFPVQVLRRDNTGGLAGASELLAFRAGVALGLAHLPAAERIMKLDADLCLEPDYLARLAGFGAETGLLGGHRVGTSELNNAAHVQGGLRAYTPAAYEGTRALPAALGWDVLDEVAIRRAGLSIAVEPLARAVASRVTGSSVGALRGRFRKGRSSRWSGYYPPYAALQIAFHLLRRPYVIGGLALGWGYVSSGSGPFAPDLKAFHREGQRVQLVALCRNPVRWLQRAYGSH